MGRTITTVEPISQGALKSELDARLVDSIHQGRLDTTVSSRAPAATALSNVTWTNARAANLDKLDAAVSSRLSLAGLQAELNSRSVDSIHLNRLDTTVSSRAPASTALSNTVWTNVRAANLDNLDATVSSRLSSTDAALDILRPPIGVRRNGFIDIGRATTAANITLQPDYSASIFNSPTNTITFTTVYSRTGSGAVLFAGADVMNPTTSDSFGLRIAIDGTVLISATHTVANDGKKHFLFFAPVGGFFYDPSASIARYTPEAYPLRYKQSVVVQAYASGTTPLTVRLKELRFA